MFGLTDAIKSLLYKYLNYYWKPPTAEELLVCVLDPRTKKIKFSSQTIQEQTFTLLKTKFMEFSQIESQISTPDNSIPKKIIKSNKIYKPSLLKSPVATPPPS